MRSGTYANYIGYIALACDILGVSAEATSGRLAKRAKNSLRKQDGPPQVRRLIGLALTRKLYLAAVEHDLPSAMLYLLTYTFLPRVPSETMSVEVGAVTTWQPHPPPGRHSLLGMHQGELVLVLTRRKN